MCSHLGDACCHCDAWRQTSRDTSWSYSSVDDDDDDDDDGDDDGADHLLALLLLLFDVNDDG